MIIGLLLILLIISSVYSDDLAAVPLYDFSGLSREDLLKIEQRLELYHHHINLIADYEKLILNQDQVIDDLRLSLDSAFIRGRHKAVKAGVIASVCALITGFIAGAIVIAR